MNKKRIFSGIQPTGNIHVGNYLGAINNWIKLQNDYDCVFSVVDLHALTNPEAHKEISQKIMETATALLAAGLDPEKCTIFIQSHVKEHTELCWLLDTVTPIAELERMTQFKDKAKQFKKDINMGLFGYPVLMAADIILYDTEIVPVGDDQKQHVELTKTIVRKFNNKFGETFVLPESRISKQEEGSRIMSLQNLDKKMSKSTPQGCLFLDDTDDEMRKKIQRAVTDSGSEIICDPERKALLNLITIYHCFSELSFKEIEEKYKGKGYKEFKEDLADVVIEGLKTFKKKKEELNENQAHVKKVLEEGAEKARELASKKMTKVRKLMGLV